jgi:hypothetical protein
MTVAHMSRLSLSFGIALSPEFISQTAQAPDPLTGNAVGLMLAVS